MIHGRGIQLVLSGQGSGSPKSGLGEYAIELNPTAVKETAMTIQAGQHWNPRRVVCVTQPSIALPYDPIRPPGELKAGAGAEYLRTFLSATKDEPRMDS